MTNNTNETIIKADAGYLLKAAMLGDDGRAFICDSLPIVAWHIQAKIAFIGSNQVRTLVTKPITTRGEYEQDHGIETTVQSPDGYIHGYFVECCTVDEWLKDITPSMQAQEQADAYSAYEREKDECKAIELESSEAAINPKTGEII